MKTYRVSHNTAFLTGALVTQKVLSFAYFWYLSNQLLPATLGRYLFALSFATLFGIGTDLGLTPLLIREAAKDRALGHRFLRNIVSLKLMLCAGAVLVGLAVTALSGKSAEVQLMILAGMTFVVLDAFTLSCWGMFKAARNLRYESSATLVVQLVIIALGVAVLQTTRQPLHLVLTLGLASAVNFGLAAWRLRRQLAMRLWPAWDPDLLRMLLRMAPAFAGSLIFVKIYNVADVVLLGYLADDVAVAHYAVPAKIVTSLQQVLPAAFAAVIYPVFSQYHQQRDPALHQLFERSFGYLIALSIPASFALSILAPEILDTVWPTYRAADTTLQVMAWSIPFIFLTFPTGYLLNACHREYRNTFNRGVITAAMVTGNLLVIPRFGFFGAGVIFLAASIALLALDLLAARGLVRHRLAVLGAVGGKVMLASLVMSLLLVWFKPYLPLAARIGLGVLTYALVAGALRSWRIPKLPSPAA